MDVTCRKCGASVPEDHAFCAECGAVMAEAGTTRQARDDDSPELAATISGQYSTEQIEAGLALSRERKRATKQTNDAGARPAAAVRKPVQPATTPAEVRSGPSLYFILGVVAVLLLGALLFYLIRVILSG